ncbi:MAG: cysteine desulfurase [Gammaproteobacteria bacterium]|nr:cysteine desulfurase [Gammaproteobacteria bacterium]
MKHRDAADFDVASVRQDFPALHQRIHGKPLVYLDSAASAQRPVAVLDAMDTYYRHDHANVHRGVHTLSQRATQAYEGAREKIRRYINARTTAEIIFTRGTTEAINLVAQSYARPRLQPGDEVLISLMEHHSNIVPWQMACEQTGATLRVAPIDQHGQLRMDAFKQLISDHTRLIAIGHISNALGTINPVAEIVAFAHEREIPVLIDGAQAMPHTRVDVSALGCDFYAFSGHKMFGPTGIGVLYGREALLDAMPPWQGGGEMILEVSFEKTTYAALPNKFEAGTPAIAEAVGLGATIDYLEKLGIEAIAGHEHDLLAYATQALSQIDGLEIVGQAESKASVVSFTLANAHPHDIGTIVDHEGVAIRTGHHCAMPVMNFFGVPATARASMALYNTRDDIDALVAALMKVRQVLS